MKAVMCMCVAGLGAAMLGACAGGGGASASSGSAVMASKQGTPVVVMPGTNAMTVVQNGAAQTGAGVMSALNGLGNIGKQPQMVTTTDPNLVMVGGGYQNSNVYVVGSGQVAPTPAPTAPTMGNVPMPTNSQLNTAGQYIPH